MDMSLTAELAQADEVLKVFTSLSEEAASNEAMKEAAKKFIPEGAKCWSAEKIDAYVIIDYQIDDIRYVVQYAEDMVDKNAGVVDGRYTYHINSKDNILMYRDREHGELGSRNVY